MSFGVVDVKGVGKSGVKLDELPGTTFLLPEAESIGTLGISDEHGLSLFVDDLTKEDRPAGLLLHGAEEFDGPVSEFLRLRADGVKEFFAESGAYGDFLRGVHSGDKEGGDESEGEEECAWGKAFHGKRSRWLVGLGGSMRG